MRALRTSRAAVAFAAVLVLAAALPCAADPHAVTSTADDGGAGTLRYELNNAADGDTIDITATGTIFLTGGQLEVDKSVTITGPGQELLTVDGQQASRVFHIAPEYTVTISGLTIANGKVGSVFGGNVGGGILNEGELTLAECTLTNNKAGRGGAVFNQGPLTLKDCTLSNNTAVGRNDPYDPDFVYYGSGGAIYLDSDDEVSLTLDSCTLSDNSASGVLSGGGALGGAIAIGVVGYFEYQTGANVIIRNSTLSGNFAVGNGGGTGGAISNVKGSLTIDNSTLAGNYDDWYDPELPGGAIINLLGSLKIKNTILANDESAANLLSLSITGEPLPIDDLGFNLCADDCSGLLESTNYNLLETDALLGPLADNGGPTLTHALLQDSPAIDAADWTDSAGDEITADQRGVERPQGGYNDIGAFESECSLPYSWSGILQPVDANGGSVFKAGSTVPVKFSLTGCSAGNIGLQATLSYIMISSAVVSSVNESVSTSSATTGNLFRYDPTSGQYLFNWSTKGLSRGTYRLFIDLGDEVEHTVDVGLR